MKNEPRLDSFAGMGEDFDELTNSLLSTQPTPAPAAPSPAVSPQPPASNVPPAAVPPAPTPAATPPVAPQETPAPPATPPAPSPQPGEAQPADPVDAVLAEMKKEEQKIFDQIVPAFALSQEDIAGMEENATAYTPKLLARTYMHAVNASLRYMQQLVPNMVQRELARADVARETQKAFFSKFPTLSAEKHGSDITAFAQMFRQQNPQITKEDLFSLVGAAVMAKYGTPANAPAAPGAPPAPPGLPSATPVAVAPVAPPFTPALGGAVVAQQPVEGNGWENMGRDFD